MQWFRIVALGTLSFGLVFQTNVAQAKLPQFDAVRDWSAESNPNGTWSYGYVTSWGVPFKLDDASGSNWAGVSAWWPSQVGPPPDVSRNDTKKQVCAETWCIPPKFLHLHPGPNGELSVLRWTAPESRKYVFRVAFEGLDWAFPTSTTFYIVQDSQGLLLQAPVNSYKQVAKWAPRPMRLVAGETIDFMVDWGQDGNYYGDSTGVAVKIW
jgi:hypothetical protein